MAKKWVKLPIAKIQVLNCYVTIFKKIIFCSSWIMLAIKSDFNKNIEWINVRKYSSLSELHTIWWQFFIKTQEISKILNCLPLNNVRYFRSHRTSWPIRILISKKTIRFRKGFEFFRKQQDCETWRKSWSNLGRNFASIWYSR